jgi:hypothetical protein
VCLCLDCSSYLPTNTGLSDVNVRARQTHASVSAMELLVVVGTLAIYTLQARAVVENIIQNAHSKQSYGTAHAGTVVGKSENQAPGV